VIIRQDILLLGLLSAPFLIKNRLFLPLNGIFVNGIFNPDIGTV